MTSIYPPHQAGEENLNIATRIQAAAITLCHDRAQSFVTQFISLRKAATLIEATAENSTQAAMRRVLDKQRQAILRNGAPDAALRRDRLRRAAAMLVRYQDRIADALSSDFGSRSALTTKAGELISSCIALNLAAHELENWMQPEERPLFPDSAGPGARAVVHYQPLGVVGVIAPWNAPFLLTFNPLAGIFAAGNSAMLKPSEFTPVSAALLAEIVDEYFDEIELAVFPGGPDVGAAFAGLAFDHLMFTGSEATARKVMRAAADNLVPVTLELGGKSPVIIGAEADLTLASVRIVHGKLLNGGQICMSPDHVFVPRAGLAVFVSACREAAAALYPRLLENEDYTTIISSSHYDRLFALVADARAKGATVVEVNPAGETFVPEARKVPLHILTDLSEDMDIMRQEIFGPLLPILPYDDVSTVIDEINHGPRPLAVYYFGSDEDRIERLVARTWSGNVAINDVVAQGLREEIPYGGVGASGMGAYKGIDGFRNFSHAKPVFYQTDVEAVLQPLRPPHLPETLTFVESLLKVQEPMGKD